MQKPTSVVVFGVLNIIFGVFGIIGLLSPFVMAAMPQAHTPNPVLQIVHDSPALQLWMNVSAIVGGVAGAAALAAGIGMLQLKPWARMLAIAYGIYGIIIVVVGAVVNCMLLWPPLMEVAEHNHGPEGVGAMAGVFGGVLGLGAGLIYPILLIVFMMRPNVVAAFSGPLSPDSQSRFGQY